MPDLEGLMAFGFGFLSRELFDLPMRWTVAHQGEQLVHRMLFAFDKGCDRTVVAIADPAVDAKRPGLVPGLGAKEDALHPAAHSNAAGDDHSRPANAGA